MKKWLAYHLYMCSRTCVLFVKSKNGERGLMRREQTSTDFKINVIYVCMYEVNLTLSHFAQLSLKNIFTTTSWIHHNFHIWAHTKIFKIIELFNQLWMIHVQTRAVQKCIAMLTERAKIVREIFAGKVTTFSSTLLYR